MENEQVESYARDLNDFLGGRRWMVNIDMAYAFGLDRATWLINLYNYRTILKSKNLLPEDDYFYISQKDIYQYTRIFTPDMQTKFIKFFRDIGVLSVVPKGIPRRNYYRINPATMVQYIAKNSQQDGQADPPEHTFKNRQMTALDPSKQSHSKYNTNKELLKKELNVSSNEETSAVSGETALQVPTRKFKRPIESKQPIQQLNAATLLRQKVSIARNQKTLTKKLTPKQTTCSDDVQDILDYWLSKGFKLPRNPSKVYKACTDNVRKLMAGRINNQTYSLSDIKFMIDNFYLAAFDENYMPTGEAKAKLRKYYISEFVVRKTAVRGELTHYNPFLKYTSEPKQVTSLLDMPEENVGFVAQLKEIYEQQVCGGVYTEYSPQVENKFRLAAKRWRDFCEINYNLIRGHISNQEGAEYLFNSVLKDAGDLAKISPGWFCSDETFNRRLPAYLNSQGALMEYAGFSIYRDQGDYRSPLYDEED